MFGNFEPTLTYKANGRRLETCGPLVWGGNTGPEPADKVTVAVTITQPIVDSDTVVATGESPNAFVNPENEWMFYVTPDKGGAKFVDGPAEAQGIFTVIEPASEAGKTFDWSQTVQLRAH